MKKAPVIQFIITGIILWGTACHNKKETEKDNPLSCYRDVSIIKDSGNSNTALFPPFDTDCPEKEERNDCEEYLLQQWIGDIENPTGIFYEKGLIPSRILELEPLGTYFKVELEPQSYTYKKFNHKLAYLINGHLILGDENYFTILDPNGKELYRKVLNWDEAWSYKLTFFFPIDKSRSFLIGIASGMEESFGCRFKVIDQNFNCVDIELPNIVNPDQFDHILPVIKIEDRGKGGIAFTFDIDSIHYNSWVGGLIPARDIEFVFINDILYPNETWNQHIYVKSSAIMDEICKTESFDRYQMGDVNGDNHIDVIISSYYKNDKIPPSITLYICEDYKIREKYSLSMENAQYISAVITEDGMIDVYYEKTEEQQRKNIKERYKFENKAFHLLEREERK